MATLANPPVPRTRYARIDVNRTAQAPSTTDSVLETVDPGNAGLTPTQVRCRILGSVNTSMIAKVRFHLVGGAVVDTAEGTAGATALIINMFPAKLVIVPGDEVFAAPQWRGAETQDNLYGLAGLMGQQLTKIELVGRRSNTLATVEWRFQVSSVETPPAGGP